MHYTLEIKLLTECPEYIPALATLWFEGISQHWVPNASVARAIFTSSQIVGISS